MDTESTHAELNRKLAEWAGFENISHLAIKPHPNFVMWRCPDGGTIFDNAPNFTQSLDACFKWLVPKLTNIKQMGSRKTVEIIRFFEFKKDSTWCHLETDWQAEFETIGETPALALCNAIEKLIDDEKDKAAHKG